MTTHIPLDVLDHMKVADPCSMRWEDLDGDERKRRCGQCRLDVYNFSAMSRAEINTLVARHEGRLCGGFYRRPDGTVMTRACPVGLRAARARARKLAVRVAAAFGVLMGGGLLLAGGRGPRLRTLEPIAGICAKLASSTPPPTPPFIMGEIMCTPPPAPASTPGDDS